MHLDSMQMGLNSTVPRQSSLLDALPGVVESLKTSPFALIKRLRCHLSALSLGLSRVSQLEGQDVCLHVCYWVTCVS